MGLGAKNWVRLHIRKIVAFSTHGTGGETLTWAGHQSGTSDRISEVCPTSRFFHRSQKFHVPGSSARVSLSLCLHRFRLPVKIWAGYHVPGFSPQGVWSYPGSATDLWGGAHSAGDHSAGASFQPGVQRFSPTSENLGVAIHSGFLQRASGAIPAVPQTCGAGFHSTGIRPTGASFRQSVHRLSPASEKLSGCVTPRISPKGVWYHTRRCHRLVVRGLTPQETRLLG